MLNKRFHEKPLRKTNLSQNFDYVIKLVHSKPCLFTYVMYVAAFSSQQFLSADLGGLHTYILKFKYQKTAS